VAHRGYEGGDGRVGEAPDHRNRRLRPSERASSTELLRGTLARFLVQDGHVEGGGHAGVLSSAREGLHRRRLRSPVRSRVSIRMELEQREKELELGFIV
jgi:hypothetical protein